MPDIDTWQEVARGDLTPDQIELLDAWLDGHQLPPSSPHSTPETLAWVCLNCGSIGEAKTRQDRDAIIDNFDVKCCGLTVVFHSNHRVLVDPANLGAVVRVTVVGDD